jgi:hypothetical protein
MQGEIPDIGFAFREPSPALQRMPHAHDDTLFLAARFLDELWPVLLLAV